MIKVTKKGLRQGDPMSPVLFNIVVDMLAICGLFLASLPRIVSPWHNIRNACVTPEVANGFTVSGRWSMQYFTRSIPRIVFSTGNEKWIN